MSTPPELTVVIPVRDGAHCIDEQLDALAAQDAVFPWELVVADNGSRDGTRAVVEARAVRFPVPVRVVDAGQKPGVSHARNTGILAARAPRIAICDADDRVGSHWVRAARGGLAVHDVVGGPLRRLTEPFDPEAPEHAFTSLTEDAVMCCNVALRRDVVLALGGFDASFRAYGREDFEFTVRLEQEGLDIGFSPELLVYYRVTPSAREMVRKVYLSAVADVMVWRRHPEVFPDRQGRGYVLREALGLPASIVRAARGGGMRRVARVLTTLAAHARVMLPPHHELPPPELIVRDGASTRVAGDVC
ncbi:glycosyltransferase [Brachybacterium sp. AOP25-B2-12]|uniref:glycosyltransferase n=1 Tax=Brachybacterium sp. AOP25-B2-12 TaxID=3457710 RepID=UPI0040341D62